MSLTATEPPLEGGRENGCCRQAANRANKSRSLQLLHQLRDSQKPLVQAARCEAEGVEITAVKMPGRREHIVNFVSRSRKGGMGEDEVRVSGGNYGRGRSRFPSCCTRTVLCIAFLILFIITLILMALLVRSHCNSDDSGSPNSSVGNPPDVGPPTQSVAATVFVSPTPTRTRHVWENFRLPTNLRPSHYRVSIQTDIEQNTFTGEVTIHFTCVQSTEYILLHTKELNYTFESFRFVSESGHTVASLSGDPQFYDEHDYMILRTNPAMRRGRRYALSMRYRAYFNGNLLGLYRDKYQTSSGETRYYVASFLSPINARRVYPCFDEPSFKANFTVTIIHPEGYTALSNMDEDTTSSSTMSSTMRVSGNWRMTSFKTTPVMSTYLVAFVVCQFDRQSQVMQNGVEFRVWAQHDAIEQTSFALTAGIQLVYFLEDYSGFRYPLPKLDMIALPQLLSAGMENWGLVTYRDDYMLYDVAATPTETLQEIAFVIAHELGHQWYSNLVTQEFWDELWLKECFASVLGSIALDDMFPDWAMWDEQFVVKRLQQVMKLDSQVTSHPIQQPVRQASDIMNNFDMISYDKSPAVLRMLEHSLGYATFRDGLKQFLRNKQYGNADASDIWQAMSSTTRSPENLRNISAIMDPWLRQMGYPVVTVSRDGCEEGNVCLTQEHFLLDQGNASDVPESKYGYIWPIPITFSSSVNADFVTPFTYWLTSRSGRFSIPNIQRDEWILVNINRTGYFRTNYDVYNWRLLCRQLEEDHTRISPASRVALIDDVFSLATEGRLNMSLALDLTKYLKYERDYVPWKGAIITLEYLDRMLRTTPVYGIYQEYFLHQANDVYEYIGWNNTGTHQQKLLRLMILERMCSKGHRGCISEVKQLFGNVTEGQSIYPDYRSFVYSTSVASGGAKEWDATWERYKTSDSTTEAQLWLRALTTISEPWLINRLLTRTLDSEQLSLTDAVTVFEYVSQNPIGGYLAWNFFRDQWALLTKRYASGLFQMNSIISAVTNWFNTEYQLEELKSFISRKKGDLNNLAGASSFSQAVDNTKANIRWMKTNYKQAEAWLEAWKAEQP